MAFLVLGTRFYPFPSTKMTLLVLGTRFYPFPSTKMTFLVRETPKSGGNWFFGSRPEK